jgi:hypothetical protein
MALFGYRQEVETWYKHPRHTTLQICSADPKSEYDLC